MNKENVTPNNEVKKLTVEDLQKIKGARLSQEDGTLRMESSSGAKGEASLL